jgi:hypothetical protein
MIAERVVLDIKTSEGKRVTEVSADTRGEACFFIAVILIRVLKY